MTTIKQLKQDLATALSMPAGLERAQAAMQVQMSARLSRSQFAYDLEFLAHAAVIGCVIQLANKTTTVTHRERSMIGGLAKQSEHMFNVGGTASRKAMRAE